MKAKQFMMATLIVMCAIAMTTVFTSCSKDDDDNKTTDDNKPTAAVMDYSLTVGDDMLNMLGLTVEYYDANGKVQSEQKKQLLAEKMKEVKAF